MGRYGNDPLNQALQYAAIALLVVSMFIGQVYPLALALMFWATFRMMSRNTSKRYAEYLAFDGYKKKVLHWLDMARKLTIGTKTHKYFSCPGCKQVIRMPRGLGEKEIRCPKCQATFTRKT